MTLKKQSIRANQTIYLDDNKFPSSKKNNNLSEDGMKPRKIF